MCEQIYAIDRIFSPVSRNAAGTVLPYGLWSRFVLVFFMIKNLCISNNLIIHTPSSQCFIFLHNLFLGNARPRRVFQLFVALLACTCPFRFSDLKNL